MSRFDNEEQSEIDSTSKKTPKEYQFIFSGNSIEYFGIWIVNIALTIITLGIYAPWAKVRREQYLLSHTTLEKSTFDYTADPWKILKGRLLVFGSAIVYTVLYKISPILGAVLAVMFFILMPWAITQSLKFKSRYISYRNIPFGFNGNFANTFVYFILIKFLGYFSLGLLFPWSKFQEKKYLVDNLRYGKVYFKLNKNSTDFYKIYMLAFLLLLPIMILGCLPLLFTVKYIMADPEQSVKIGAAVAVAYFILFAVVLNKLTRLMILKAVWDGTTIANFKLNFTASTSMLIYIGVTNFLLQLITLGLAAPFCTIRMRRYIIKNLSIGGSDTLDNFLSHTTAELNALGEQAAEIYDVDIDIGF